MSVPRGGGGAVRGIGETFSTDAATGTVSLSIPIATSPGRAGFEVGLALTYDSGAGNGPFGIGWTLSVPSITRKTDKGLPRYQDGDGPDVFVLSGAEDLVPARVSDGAGTQLDVVDRVVDGIAFRIQRYRPRVEGAFARIERWTDRLTGDVHWRATTGDNVTSIYGRTAGARIADPDVPRRVFSWLLEETRDDRGNLARYTYKAEDRAGISSRPCEVHRFEYTDGTARLRPRAQRYLKRIEYGNARPDDPAQFLFEVVFDYGEHDDAAPTPDEVRPWPARPDPFSSYRAGFEVRTYRLCRRVLMFHRFAELGDEPCLVRSTGLSYDEGSVVTYLTGVTQAGYVRDEATGAYERAALPALELDYTRAVIHDRLETPDRASFEGISGGVDGVRAMWVDLDGEGIPGVLVQAAGALAYKRNLGGVLTAPVRLPTIPAGANLAVQQLVDVDGDGRLELASYTRPLAGYYARTDEGAWKPFEPFTALPNINWNDPNLVLIDADGDGHPDLLITERDAITCYRSRGKDGFEPAVQVPKPRDEREGPVLVFSSRTEAVFVADMSGDGLDDIVRIRNGQVCYWPNLGHGRFGRQVLMDRSPRFDADAHFDPRRIRLADIDGSGTADIIYMGRRDVSIHLNEAGNAIAPPRTIRSLPLPAGGSSVAVVDLLGQGTACLVWSSPLTATPARPFAYVDLMNGKKPHLLASVRNNLGGETRIAYAPSTRFYLADRAAGKRWLTRLPFPVQVVERVEVVDHVTGSKLSTRYRYHHGYYDGHEREFRGFACVEQFDAETFGAARGKGLFPEVPDGAPDELALPPVHSKTWFHTGAWLDRRRLEAELAREYYAGDPDAPLLPDTVLPAGLSVREEREAARALRGKVLRQEVYADDGTEKSVHPYAVSEQSYAIRVLQRAAGADHAVFFVHPAESVALHYERNPADPRLEHELVLEVDDFGNVTRAASLAYPRRQPAQPEQARPWATVTEATYANRAGEPNWYRIGVPIESATSELTGLATPARRLLAPDALREALAAATELPYEATPSGVSVERRVIARGRATYYRDDLTGPLPLGEFASHALPYESYRLALTPGLVTQVYGDRVTDAILADEARYVKQDDLWWAPSGRVIFDPAGFYLPVEAIDPHGERSFVRYDDYHLLAVETEDALGNKVTVGLRDASDVFLSSGNDYRVLGPALVSDENRNQTAVAYDALGLVVATAVMGKEGAGEGDTLADPTVRITYDLSRWQRTQHDARPLPAVVTTAAREQHGPANQRWQISLAYTDGLGREVMTKVQAEPGRVPVLDDDGSLRRNPDGTPATVHTDTRWIGTGRTVFDNKGNPVKQYEPFFSATFEYEDEAELVEWGVTPILRYDALGRLVRTDNPDGTHTKVVFDPWHHETWDESDTVADTPWLVARQAGSAAEQRSAALTLEHTATPAVAHLDALGRPFLAIADNGPRGTYETRTEVDIEGNPRTVTDARGVRVLTQSFDLLGRAIFGDSADAGISRSLVDATDRPLRAWDARGHQHRRAYDALGRPTHLYVRAGDGPELLVERTIYGETHPDAVARSLRGQAHRVYDGAGMLENSRFDFAANLLESTRRLARQYKETVDWSPLAAPTDLASIEAAAEFLLADESFTTTAAYDALGRLTARATPDGSETRPTYNEASLLEAVTARLRGAADATTFVDNIDYNARGQRERIDYGNGTSTTYAYDDQTFRLTRQQTVRASDGATLQDLAYTYDAPGNIVEIADGVSFGNPAVSADGLYEYDALYQLVTAEGREHPGQQPTHADPLRLRVDHPSDMQALHRYRQRYEYDAVGNIERMVHLPLQAGATGWTRRYLYASDSNRLLATSAPGDTADTLSAAYTHDAAGNMTAMPHLAAMRWDHSDRLQHADRGGGGHVYFAYDAAGQRVRKVYEHGAFIEERIYLGDFELYRKRHAGTGVIALERETLHVSDDQRRIALVETKTVDTDTPAFSPSIRLRFQLDNHLGSSVLELDADARVITYEEYFPFGDAAFHAAHSAAEVSARRYRYTGMERDEETGLSYHGARYYAPWLGRWTSADPAGSVDGPNLYCYVRSNPLALVDRTGTSSRKARIEEEIRRTAYDHERLLSTRERLLNKVRDQEHKHTMARDKLLKLLDPDDPRFRKDATKFASKLRMFSNNIDNISGELEKTRTELQRIEDRVRNTEKSLLRAQRKGIRAGLDAPQLAETARVQARDDLVDERFKQRKLDTRAQAPSPSDRPSKPGGSGPGIAGGGTVPGGGVGTRLASKSAEVALKGVATYEVATTERHDDMTIPIILYFLPGWVALAGGTGAFVYVVFTEGGFMHQGCADPKLGDQDLCRVYVHPDAPEGWRSRLIPGVPTGYEVGASGQIRYK